MIPVFTICVIILMIIFTVGRVRNTHAQQQVQDDFWERERQANYTRKQDISQLDYITIPLEKFPLDLGTEAEHTIQELADKKILNLTGYTNTDLKLTYGQANFSVLSECDDNFTRLVPALSQYSHELLEAGREADAMKVLQFGVSIHADSSDIYTGLAQLYQAQHNTAGIEELIQSAKELHSMTRDSLVRKLENYLPKEE